MSRELRIWSTWAVWLLGLLSGTAVGAPRGYAVWPELSLVKVFRDSGPRPGCPEDLWLEGARGEVVAGQVVVRADDFGLASVTVSVSPLRRPDFTLPASCVRLLLPHYVRVDHPSGNRVEQPRDWPDPLPAFEPFDLEPRQTQPVWIEVDVPREIPPGEYRGAILVSPANRPATTLPFLLTVRRPQLPEVPYLRTAFGVWWDGIAERFGLVRNSPEFLSAADRFFWFLVEHRITPLDPPVSPLSSEADRYLADPRVRSVRIPFDRGRLAETGKLLRTRSWREKAFFCLLDEPALSQFPVVREDACLAAQEAPEVSRLCTIQPDPRLFGSINIWCPNLEAAYIHADQIRTLAGWKPAPPQAGEDLSSEVPRGGAKEEVWWYTAVVPKYPYPTFLLDDDAVAPRALFWMAAAAGVEGVLYINTIHWGPPGWDPWAHSVITMPDLRNNGDGLLVYTPREALPSEIRRGGAKEGTLATGEHPAPAAYARPISSIRLEAIRDGIEDYDLLRLMADRIDQLKRRLGQDGLPYGGQDRVKEIAGEFIRDPRDWDRDPARIAEARSRVLRELEETDARPWAVVGTLPRESARTSCDRVLVFGAVEPGAQVGVNGRSIPVEQNCTFRTTVPLHLGPNRIEINVEKAGIRKPIVREISRAPWSAPRAYEPAKVMMAVPCVPEETPEPDGRLNEDVWRRAPAIRLSRNLNGSIWPTGRTLARAAYNEWGLWLGFEGVAPRASGRGVGLRPSGRFRARTAPGRARGSAPLACQAAGRARSGHRSARGSAPGGSPPGPVGASAPGPSTKARAGARHSPTGLPACRAAGMAGPNAEPPPTSGGQSDRQDVGPDSIAIYLAPDRRAQWSLRLTLDPSGEKRAETAWGRGRYRSQWKGQWLSGMNTRADGGWTAEVGIPWSDLGLTCPPRGPLLVNFSRRSASTGEQTWWASRFGARDQFEKYGLLLLR